MSDINTFEDLEVWKRGCQLAVDVYVANHTSKDFGLRDQMQRAAVSIPSNIAEGCERDSTPEFIKFFRYSKGSCGANFAPSSTFPTEFAKNSAKPPSTAPVK